jgi:signal transduction histidine kinase
VFLFSMSVALLLAFIYWSTAAFMEDQTNATIDAEIRGLAERYSLSSMDGLVRSINDRLKRNPYGNTIFLLTDPRYEPVTGNLNGWPARDPGPEGWLEFELEQVGGDGRRHFARARTFVLPGNYHLLVGRDMYELRATQGLIRRTLVWGLLITALLALAGGVMMSRSTLRRIEIINAISREIIRGDLSRRIPTSGSADDFDQLAANLNSMLDQIQHLMDGVRHVSDNIAHDLKTPLTRLRNRLESLSHTDCDNREEAEMALAEADAMLATFNALLRIARIEAGARREAFAEVDLRSVVEDVVELYEPVTEEREQLLGVALADTCVVQGDRDLLFQAVVNLLDNASKYTPPGGRIGIELSGGEPGACLTIRDSGPGIPIDDRSRVMDRFVRLERSRTTPGNGLGLSLVAAVAKLHAAQLSLDDAMTEAGEGRGLMVSLQFPRPARRNRGRVRRGGVE